MTFEIRADGVDVEAIMSAIRKRIDEKKLRLYTEEEVREIAERRLDAVLDAHEFNADFAAEFRARTKQWNYEFHPETIYESSRGAWGQLLRRFRSALRPVQKLFWNPNPMIAALSRQADINKYEVQLLNNLVLELTRLNLEVQDLRNRNLELQGRLDFLARREKTLETMVVFRDDEQTGDEKAQKG